jgi:hypothetical protein
VPEEGGLISLAAVWVCAATSGWTVIGALGAAIGGVGAALGGGAAWKAASASRATSRDALEALGLALAPSLFGDAVIDPRRDGSDLGEWRARVINTSAQFAASKLRFEAGFEDGVRAEGELERLEPGASCEFTLRTIGMPPGGPLPEEAGKFAVLRYSDERGILRYELQFGFLQGRRGDGTPFPSISMIAVSEPLRI